MSHVHTRPYRGRTNEWGTPPELIAALGPFDDDPAMPGKTDGLEREWHGIIWLNPPYGPDTGTWMRRLVTHGSGIACVFARTDTRWFIETVWNAANAVLFLHGRPHFYRDGIRAKGNSGAPIVLASYGSEAQSRLAAGRVAGTYLSPLAARGACECGAEELKAAVAALRAPEVTE